MMTGRSLLLLVVALALSTVSAFSPTKAYVRTSVLKVRASLVCFVSFSHREVHVVGLIVTVASAHDVTDSCSAQFLALTCSSSSI